jgi:hypothetical protein
VTLVDLDDNSLVGRNHQGVNSSGSHMPDFTPGNLEINHNPRNGQPYLNTSLFSLAPLGSPDTAASRFFYGPGMGNWDIAVLKVTHFSEMRLETFDTFNHAQFFGPTSVNAKISCTSFGQVVSAIPHGVMQVGAKFTL